MSNVDVQDEHGGAQHLISEHGSTGSAVGEERFGECSALCKKHLWSGLFPAKENKSFTWSQ